MMSGLLVDETQSSSHNVAMTMTRLADQGYASCDT
jgi:hypothetical protein